MADTGSPWNLPIYTVNDVSNGAAEVTALATQVHAKLTVVNTPAVAAVNPPELHVYRNAGYTIAASNAWTLITWDSEITDTGNVFSGSNSRLILPVTGKYRVDSCAATANITVGNTVHVMARLNAAGSSAGGTALKTTTGATYATQGNYDLIFPVTGIATDYVEFFINQSTAGTIAAATGQYNTYARLTKERDGNA